MMSKVHRQGGVVLILVLILLLVLSVAALAAMRLATLEALLSADFGERSRSQQLAEAALVQAETWVREAAFAVNTEGQLCKPDGQCFSNQCVQGLCFLGSYELLKNDPDSCILAATEPGNAPFQDRNLWADSASTQWNQSDDAGELIAQVLMLIEWRCFIPLNPLDASNAEHRFQTSHWQPLYRISAYSRGRTGSSRLLLQSQFASGLGRQSWREVPILFTP